MYKEYVLHRTQIYFEESLFEEIKKEANSLGISISAYIRDVLKRDLDRKKREPKKVELSRFAGLWKNRDITQKSLREKAWK